MEENLAKQVLICSLLTALVLLSCPVIMSSEVEDESEFNYDVKGKIGPFNWGDIKPEWSLCKTGTMQSPIDLSNAKVQTAELGPLQLNSKPSKAILKNRGHDISLQWPATTSSLQINGTQYVLKQSHWHSPSEHTIDGRRMDLELHMVHQTPSDQTAVIGILYKAGERPDPFLSLFANHILPLSDRPDAEKDMGVIDPMEVKIGTSATQYYRYIGSLTTPPCTENVIWTVLKEVKPVAREHIKLLRDAVHDDSATNARPLQPVKDRSVQSTALPTEVKDEH